VEKHEDGVKETSVLSEAKRKVQTQTEYLRATVRVNSRVPIAVEWREGGQTHRADGVTTDVSMRGCMAVVPQGFAIGQKLRVLNKVTGLTCDATLVWRGHEGRTGWELGLELQSPPEEFWGVEF
jgi:hypothetical protein